MEKSLKTFGYIQVGRIFMKTEQLKDFYNSLSELNNSFTHYNFVWNQFNSDYLEIIKDNPETQTNDYFKENSFKRKHNIKFIELENEHKKTYQTLINGIFVLINLNFESYLKNILEFSISVDSKILKYNDKITVSNEDSIVLGKVFNRINIDKKNIDIELLDTLDYFRLKRNRLIHSNSKYISTTITELLKNKGISLNKFWNKNSPSKLQGIDFTNKENFDELTFSIVIDSINTFRKIAEEINNEVIKKLTFEKIFEKIILVDFAKNYGKKINKFKTEKKINKFKSYCKSEFGIEVNDIQIQKFESSLA